jgi:hypothetical protein
MSECDGDAMSWRERGRLARARGASDEEGDDEGGSGGSWSAGSPSLPSFFLPFPSLPSPSLLARRQGGRQARTGAGEGRVRDCVIPALTEAGCIPVRCRLNESFAAAPLLSPLLSRQSVCPRRLPHPHGAGGGCYSVTFLDPTPRFDWYVVPPGPKSM